MKEWYTAREIAEMGLPGLPGTEWGVKSRATREGWPFRARSGRGGGREYSLSALPFSARADIARRVADASNAPRMRTVAISLLNRLARPFGLAVIERRFLPAIEEAVCAEKIEELTRRKDQARRTWRGGRP